MGIKSRMRAKSIVNAIRRAILMRRGVVIPCKVGKAVGRVGRKAFAMRSVMTIIRARGNRGRLAVVRG